MANTSIYNAFDRMWQHTVAAIGEKAGNKVYVQADEPTDAQTGELWYDTDDGSESPNINDINIDASSIASGQVPVEHGGTGASTADEARTNLGAAPAGYGLGGNPSTNLTTLEELDVVRGSGWYTFAKTGTTINGMYFNYALVKFDTHSANQAWQELRPVNTQTVLSRAYYNGTWSEWECDNPPMVAGTEYRTTERCNGRPVFKKLVSYNITSQVGNNSTTTTLAVPHDITGFGQAIRVEAWKGNYIFPMLAASGGTTNITTVDATNINFRMRNDYVGAGNMYISLSYIKSDIY